MVGPRGSPLVVVLQWATVRDNFLSLEHQKRFATLALLPNWGWREWLIGDLTITLLAFMEGTYRRFTFAQKNVDDLKNRLAEEQSIQRAADIVVSRQESGMFTGLVIENISTRDKDAHLVRLGKLESHKFYVTANQLPDLLCGSRQPCGLARARP